MKVKTGLGRKQSIFERIHSGEIIPTPHKPVISSNQTEDKVAINDFWKEVGFYQLLSGTAPSVRVR